MAAGRCGAHPVSLVLCCQYRATASCKAGCHSACHAAHSSAVPPALLTASSTTSLAAPSPSNNASSVTGLAPHTRGPCADSPGAPTSFPACSPPCHPDRRPAARSPFTISVAPSDPASRRPIYNPQARQVFNTLLYRPRIQSHCRQSLYQVLHPHSISPSVSGFQSDGICDGVQGGSVSL